MGCGCKGSGGTATAAKTGVVAKVEIPGGSTQNFTSMSEAKTVAAKTGGKLVKV